VEGRRFEVPARYRHLAALHVRYARWDLRAVDLVDPHTKTILATLYPLDKAANADGRRRRLAPPPLPEPSPPAPEAAGGVAPLLRKLMGDYAATGLPPAYLPPPQASQSASTADEETRS
jgi:putative transposase